MKKNGMFWVFIILSLVSIGVAVYTGYAISNLEYSDTGVVIEEGRLLALVFTLAGFMIAVVLIGFFGINLYARKAHQAENANRAKTDFFSRMSHDMRTPMSAIIGLSRMAYESDDMPTIKNYLEVISTSGNHLLQLVNDVLDLSAIEAGRFKLTTRPVDLQAEINKVVGIIVPELDEMRQELSVKIDEDVPQYVKCDAIHLRQILVNLLGNAVRFTGEEGRIRLSVSLAEGDEGRANLVWHVKDSGVGMDANMAANIFTPFDTATGPTRFEHSGTGLGLPIASQLVHMMGGNIGVDSEIGRGSDFHFNIWVDIASPEEYVSAGVDVAKYATVDLSEKRVLVFEDLSTNRLIAENVLRKMGATVTFAQNGLQGVNMYIENPDRFDMIFMDVKMPVMDGFEATRQIRASSAPGAQKIPIIAMTASAFKEDAKRALEAGMNAHVGKPFDVVDVEKALLDINIRV